MTSTRARPGAICLSSSGHLPPIENWRRLKPVRLPPGFLSLATKPCATGSALIENAAGSLDVQVTAAPIRSAADIEPALAKFASAPNGGLIVLNDSFTRLHYSLIAAAAQRYRLPSIAGRSGFAREGGLLEYGVDINLVSQYREAAAYVDRILRGSKPGDLPVQAPSRFETVINLKAAKALGLDVPADVLLRADEVIE
jgi:putative tryptophan/tyrosine transport system substrate-binding protein